MTSTCRRPRAAKLGGMFQEVVWGYEEDNRRKFSPQKDWRVHRYHDSLLNCAEVLHASGSLRVPKTWLLAGEWSWVADQEETNIPSLTRSYSDTVTYHCITFRLVEVSSAGSSPHISKEELGSIGKLFLTFFIQWNKDSLQWSKQLKCIKRNLGTGIDKINSGDCFISIHSSRSQSTTAGKSWL